MHAVICIDQTPGNIPTDERILLDSLAVNVHMVAPKMHLLMRFQAKELCLLSYNAIVSFLHDLVTHIIHPSSPVR